MVAARMFGRVSIDPEICHGKPCIAGTRIMVTNILSQLAGGYTIERIPEGYPELTREDVTAAIHNQAALARARFEQFDRECHAFERAHGMSSEEFMRRFEAGELGDDADFFDWFASKRGRDIWERKYRILSEVSW